MGLSTPQPFWKVSCLARGGFLRKWKLRCKAVSASFEEGGDELFTFTAFPSSPWKALRTTNALERINEEFRRRTKTQASLPSEKAVLFSYAAVKYGCVAWSVGRI